MRKSKYIPTGLILHKYKAQRTESDGIKFDSKLEAKYYANLKLWVHAGAVIFFLRQVPFHLPGGVIFRIDFVEFRCDGTVRFVEVKGFETKEWKMKRRLVEALYPITIEVIK